MSICFEGEPGERREEAEPQEDLNFVMNCRSWLGPVNDRISRFLILSSLALIENLTKSTNYQAVDNKFLFKLFNKTFSTYNYKDNRQITFASLSYFGTNRGLVAHRAICDVIAVARFQWLLFSHVYMK